ncbi:rho GTPase-activating protein 18 [Nematostella vectensis]|uniref:rho GTPase-activating protein 18 n=1 Tax=Nematostella vectensis TaxID=45351 RepID=UPI0020779187|nr:rho GTPase-activating protein 18 [Nematostella vectensis]XP_048589877.1 rho GTPase-activating protein 18 [Nematostella vectensis]
MAMRVKQRHGMVPPLDQLEYDDFWKEFRSIEESGRLPQPEDEHEEKDPAEGDQEVQWLKEAGFDEIVKKYRDSKEINPEDLDVQNITSSLTRKQAEAVRRRINTLNEYTKKRLSSSDSPSNTSSALPASSKHSNYTDVRTIFPVQTTGQPSNATTSSSTSYPSTEGTTTTPVVSPVTSPTAGHSRRTQIRRPSLPRRAASEGVNLMKPFRDDSSIESSMHGLYTSLAEIRTNGESLDKEKASPSKLVHPLAERRASEDVRVHSEVQQTRHTHGSVFYVTGRTKEDLFNAAEKTKESSVDDLEDSRLKVKDVSPRPSSPPDPEQPECFHEAPVDVPSESLSPKLNEKNNGVKSYSGPQFPRLPNFTLTKDELGLTHISDMSKEDMEKVRSLALIELTALFDQHGIALHRRKPIKKKVKECGIFEVPLQYLVQHDRLKGSNSNVPLFLQEMIRFLDHNSLTEEGILRVGGATARMKALREEIEETFNEGAFSLDGRRVHDVAGLLKQFLRELPFPLLTYEYQPTFASVENIPDRRQQLQALNLLILLLPSIHRDCLRVLLTFLSRIISYEKQNKMNLNNVSMIMAPNLFHFSSSKEMPSLREVKQAQATVNLVRMLIKYQNILWTIPGFMVMQVRYLYEAEGNRKIKDAKAVRKLLLKKGREGGGGSPQKKHSITDTPMEVLEAELANNIIRVKAPMLNKIAMAIQLTDGMRAGDIVAKFRRRPGEDAEGSEPRPSGRRHKRDVMSPEYRNCVNPHDNNKFAHDRHHLYEVGGNIGERCLDNDTNMKALYKVNPHAEWIIKPRSDYE